MQNESEAPNTQYLTPNTFCVLVARLRWGCYNLTRPNRERDNHYFRQLPQMRPRRGVISTVHHAARSAGARRIGGYFARYYI